MFPKGIHTEPTNIFVFSFDFLLGCFPRTSVSRLIPLQQNVATSSKAAFSTRGAIRSQGELIHNTHPCRSPSPRVYQTFSEGVPGICTQKSLLKGPRYSAPCLTLSPHLSQTIHTHNCKLLFWTAAGSPTETFKPCVPHETAQHGR